MWKAHSSKTQSGNIFEKNLTLLFSTPGIIINFPFSALSIPIFATCSLGILGALKTTFATLLKFVSTGPGHKMLIFTLLFFFFIYLLIARDNLLTLALEA